MAEEPHRDRDVTGARWSVALGVLGLVATAAVLAHRRRRAAREAPVLEWALGLLALMPAWLVAFISLLQVASSGPLDRGVRRTFMASSAALLLGVIGSDAMARRLRELDRGTPALLYWCLGLAAVAPAWMLVLLWVG